MEYTRQETIVKLGLKLGKKIEKLYKADFVNWKGKTSDTGEYYTEVIAKELLTHLKAFYGISPVTRNSSYRTVSHSRIEIDLAKSNRDEENFAKRIMGLELEYLGIIKDFQIPLKSTLDDAGLGKIDLISYKEDTKTLFLIELKYKGNEKDTLLRSLLEIYTYYKTIDTRKLISDYGLDVKMIKPVVLLVPECLACEELRKMKSNERPMLKALAHALEIKFFTLALELSVNETIL